MKDSIQSILKKYISRKQQEVETATDELAKLKKRNKRLISKAEEYSRRYGGSSSDFQNRINLLDDVNPNVNLGLYSGKISGIDIIDKLILFDVSLKALFKRRTISSSDYRNCRAYTDKMRGFIRARYMSKEMYDFILNISLEDFLEKVGEGNELCLRTMLWERGMSYQKEVIEKRRPWEDLMIELQSRPSIFNSIAGVYVSA
jgi:hypothetical protein